MPLRLIGQPCRPGSKTNITRSIGCWTYEHTPRPIRRDRHHPLSGIFRAARQPSIYTVAVYSGYFLRRQFNFSVKRQRGWIAAASFLQRQNVLGTFEKSSATPGRLLYQLHAKWLYRIVGQENSQNRRPKSPREIRRRLIMLDYVLAHLGKEEFLESEASRRKFFAQFGVKEMLWPPQTGSASCCLSRSGAQTGTSPFCFTFIDEGQRSIAKFERFLSTHDKLLCSLPASRWSMSPSPLSTFKQAQHLFEAAFPRNAGDKPEELPRRSVDRILQPNPEGRLSHGAVKDCYPSLSRTRTRSMMRSGRRERQDKQKSLFSSEMPNEAV